MRYIPSMSAGKLSITIPDIADHIRKLLLLTPESTLPSATTFARHFRCSTKKVLEAFAILREEGCLDYAPGRRAVIRNRRLSDPPRKANATDALYEKIRNRIEAGRYRPGMCLPKVDHWVIEDNVSNHTVLKAYNRLIEDKLLRKTGRSWIVGSPVTESNHRSRPVILVVEPIGGIWGALLTEQTSQFVSSFIQEAENAQIFLAGTARFIQSSKRGEPDQSRATATYARELGDRYLGSLLVGDRRQFNRIGESPEKFVEALVPLGKPIIWFDRLREGITDPVPRRLFRRAVFSEKGMVRAAVQHLVDRGYHRIGYVQPQTPPKWVACRRKLLIRELSSIDLQYNCPEESVQRLGLNTSSDTEDFIRRTWSEPNSRAGRILRNLFIPSDRPSSEKIRSTAKLIHHLAINPETFEAPHSEDTREQMTSTDLLQNLGNGLIFLLDDHVDCLVIPRDRMLHTFYPRLAGLGIMIPRDIAMVSFDNDSETALMPIDTVDNDARGIGYRAFHTIRNDLPLRKSSSGDIEATPFVVSRGSTSFD